MTPIVLLAVAAAWAAVLVPPMLRSRSENRPGSSVTDFHRQLSSLQRAVPTRNMTPMRSMARPLAPSPLQRASTGRQPGKSARQHRDVDQHRSAQPRRSTHQHRISRREMVRRRRTNVLFVLVVATAATLFLAATTQSPAMVYSFALAFVSLCGYCYRLAQLRQYEQDRASYGDRWYPAA
jgi:Flp pilus assembly protein TadB